MMTTATENQPKIYTAHARGEWTGGFRSEMEVRQFDPIVMDEPPSLGGTDTGANPMEYLLSALIGCETVVFAIVAQERGFTYSDVKFDLQGSLDLRGLEGVEGVRPYFEKITGTIQVTTTESQDKLAEIAQEAERRCPVYTTLEAADVAFEVEWQAVRP